MALPTDYSSLKDAIEEWSHRGDLTDRFDEFIGFAEARMYDELILRNMESEESLTLTQDQNYVALPSGYVSPIALWLVIDEVRVPLDMVLAEQLPYYPDSTQPRLFAIDGDNIRFDVPAGQAYSAKFRMVKKSNLSDSNTTNSLLSNRPDVYLAACLSECARWSQDAQMFNTWETKYVKGRDALKAADSRNRQTTLRTDFALRGKSNILIDE